MDGTLSGQRAARNQSLYRSVNEQITQLNEAFSEVFPDSESLSEWICECADTTCGLRIKATRQEYELVRANGRTFIVYPGHVYPEVEGVLSENERFMVVEKFDEGGQVAETLDPRAT
jgi:4-hydroxy-3-methylbut-2-enyl diphosphate reductase IspH